MVLNFFMETFRLGLKNIYLHKLRSLLTMLGIILGVGAVIVMVAIGEGGKQAALDQVRQLGAQNILVRSVQPPEGNDNTGKSQRFLEYGIRRLDKTRLETIPSLIAIVPNRDTQQRIVYGERRIPGNAIGTTPQIFDVIKLPLDRGRYFNQIDYDQQSPVCVLGAIAAQQLFPYEDPLGQTVEVGGQEAGVVMMQVIGVLEQTGLRPGTSFINRVIDQDVYFPLSLAQTVWSDNIVKRGAGTREQKTIELTEIWLQARSINDVEATAQVVENILKMNHPVKDYEVKAPIEILRNAESLARTFNFVLGGIAAISLIVGGIGIMNIMLASITERTKEIGIRRALGAKRRHITLQFLIETTVISLSGGVIGVSLGCVVAVLLPPLIHFFSATQNYPTQIATWSVLGSFVVSGLIGVGFGLYPAMTAARMNPIEALRHE